MQNYFFRQSMPKISLTVLLAAAFAFLAGCGGGGAGEGTTSTGGTTTSTGGTPTTVSKPTQTLTGTVATGDPVVGATVRIQDSTGAAERTGQTNVNGTFSIDVTGLTPPFMLVSTLGSNNMYSVVPKEMDMTTTNTKIVNITPVTTLVMYELNNGVDPATMYTTRSYTTLTDNAVRTKEVIVRSKLPANAVNPVFSMMYGHFLAQRTSDATGYDSALHALGQITIGSSNVVTLGTTTYTVGTSGGTTGTPSVTLTLRNTADTADVPSVDSSTPALVKATVRNANGSGVANAIVTFTTDAAFGSFSGGANTALTDATGVAKVTLTTTNTSGGASTVTANTAVGGVATTGALNYAVGASSISLSPITLGPNPLSAYGTTSISVRVLNNGADYTSPMPVSFTSTCAASGKATLTTSVTTVNGVAAASYLDNGCNNPTAGDTVTASLSNGTSVSGSLKVSAPELGSIQFVSVATNPATTPPTITLKGTGGASRSETAQVTFRVVDNAGNPVGGQTVNFSLNTKIGKLDLGSTSAISDPTTGNVVTNVISGTFATAVRVTATTGGLSSQSDQLVISTGIPAQDSFSLSASTHNIEGWNHEGVTTSLNARLADHFHNPVPDGTTVYFTSEGGSIAPSCTTVGGVCSVTLTSQDLRPGAGTTTCPNGCGRLTVLARATGEEAFVDLNSNGTADAGEMIDANTASTDMGEAYVDYNENGEWDLATEPFIDFNGSGAYDGTTTTSGAVGGTTTGDGEYNGLLCTSGAAICSAQKSIDVRASQIIVFSTSYADLTINGGATINLPICTSGGAPGNYTVTVVDQNGNAMPAGTRVDFATTNGTITSATSYTVPDTVGCRSGYAGCPALYGSAGFGNIGVSIKTDASTDGLCTDTTGRAGTFSVTVTSPKGGVTSGSVTITD